MSRTLTDQQVSALAQPILDEIEARVAILEASGLRRSRAVAVAIMQMAGRLEIVSC